MYVEGPLVGQAADVLQVRGTSGGRRAVSRSGLIAFCENVPVGATGNTALLALVATMQQKRVFTDEGVEADGASLTG